MSIGKGTEELDDRPMGPQMHPKGRHHALLGQVESSQAAGGDRIGGAKGIQEVLHIIIELLELPRLLQLVGLLHILHHSVVLQQHHSQ